MARKMLMGEGGKNVKVEISNQEILKLNVYQALINMEKFLLNKRLLNTTDLTKNNNTHEISFQISNLQCIAKITDFCKSCYPL